jgi:hypothetical protein
MEDSGVVCATLAPMADSGVVCAALASMEDSSAGTTTGLAALWAADPTVVTAADTPAATATNPAADRAAATVRQARCRPTVQQDMFGINRYAYAAPGCEYGKNK